MADDIVREARDALDASFRFDKDNRSEALQDFSFVAGFQWSEDARAERAGRPIITINRSGQFIRQVANPIRQNMPTIKVEPDGDDQEQMADIANGLIRRILYNSSASHVFANAVEHMVACGIGWWRVTTDYLNENSFDQEILVKRIFNPLTVYPDPDAREPDRSDMGFCLVSEEWSPEAFKKKWPKATVDSINAPTNGITQQSMGWSHADKIRVAEYWRKKSTTKQIIQLQTGDVIDAKHLDGPYGDRIKPLVHGTRDVASSSVEMTLVSGKEQLEETYTCPCKWIPIIPVIGAEIPLERGVYRHGLIRFQREPQQLHNYFMSVAAESLGQQPKSPYTVDAKSIKNYKSVWDNANRISTPYLPYDADPALPNGGRPTREPPAPLPAGMIQMAQMLADDMKATTGIYDAALGAQSNETSGVAIGQRVQQGDQATFHFVDNLEHGLEHLGRVLLDMIPKVYDTERTLKIKAEGAAKEQPVTINKPLLSVDGQDIVHNDMSTMSFSSVRVILGQNFASRKQQTSQTLIGLLQAMPQVGVVAPDIIAENLDIDQAEELAERLRVTLPPPIQQMIAAHEQQQNAPPGAQPPPPGPPPPSPEEQAQQQQMQQQQQAHELQMQMEAQAGQLKLQQEGAKAAQEAQRVQTEQFKSRKAEADYQIALKKLREPPPDPNGSAASMN